MTRTAVLAVTVIGSAVGLYAAWIWLAAEPFPPGLVRGNGRVEGTEVAVATTRPGEVEQVLVREGDDVEAGQVLAAMDARALKARLQRARAELERARSSAQAARAEVRGRQSALDLADSDIQRSLQLYEQEHVPESRVDRDLAVRSESHAAYLAARAMSAEADAAVEVARAAVAELEVELEDTQLRSPVSGRILYRLAEPGEVLPAGGKLLVVIDLDELYMTLYLPERHAGRVPVGGEARIRVDAYPEREFLAAVSFVAPEAEFTPKEVETTEERQKLVFRTRLVISDNRDRLLKPGMPGVGYVRTEDATPWPPRLP